VGSTGLAGNSVNGIVNSITDDLLKRHSWWSRVWVIQEVVLSQNVTVHRGKHHILWRNLIISLLWLLNQLEWPIKGSAFGRVINLDLYKRRWAERIPIPLFRLINEASPNLLLVV
jgi:hypothetical protein